MRCFARVPNYEKLHFRHYLENPKGFKENIPADVKFNYEMRKNMEDRLMQHVDLLSQSEKVNLIGKMIPEYSEAMFRLRTVSTKYATLINRLHPLGPHPVLSRQGK